MSDDDESFTYHWIVPSLAQGSYPDPPNRAPKTAFENFDVLILAAEEHQAPRYKPPPGKLIYRVPLDDDPYQQLPREVAEVVMHVANAAGSHLVSGKKTLSTCHMGLNRSGLVTGLILMQYFRMTPAAAIRLIRQKRDRDALCNPMFEQFLHNVRVG
jgi:protein-tyrosine phosphatase